MASRTFSTKDLPLLRNDSASLLQPISSLDVKRPVAASRISRCVKEHLDAFMKALLELIPKDLVNERELELLIGGMSEIDMCVFFLHLTLLLNTDPSTTGMIRPRSPTTAATRKPKSHRTVLDMHPCLASCARILSASIQHWYVPCTHQWLQRSPGLWRSEKVWY